MSHKHFNKAFKSQEKGAADEACCLLRQNPSVAATMPGSIRMAVMRAGGDPEASASPAPKPAANPAAAEAAALGINFCVQYTKFSATPNQLLRFYLAQMEPQAMSPFALKALNAKNARECPRHVLSELCEFITGVGTDEVIPKHARASVDACINFLRNRNQLRQRGALSIQLPCNWDEDGLFTIDSVDEGHVTVSFRMEPAIKVRIAVCAAVRKQGVSITNNWSEKSAALVTDLAEDGEWNLAMEFARRDLNVSKISQPDLHSRAAYDRTIARQKRVAGTGLAALEDGSPDRHRPEEGSVSPTGRPKGGHRRGPEGVKQESKSPKTKVVVERPVDWAWGGDSPFTPNTFKAIRASWKSERVRRDAKRSLDVQVPLAALQSKRIKIECDEKDTKEKTKADDTDHLEVSPSKRMNKKTSPDAAAVRRAEAAPQAEARPEDEILPDVAEDFEPELGGAVADGEKTEGEKDGGEGEANAANLYS